MRNRTLRLRTERLAELTPAQLLGVAAGTIETVDEGTPTLNLICRIKKITEAAIQEPDLPTHYTCR